MRLQRVILENFRQFYGTQVLEFARAEERNVTLVFGANGAGKTTLLNAFTWVLYRQFTPSFEDPDGLINERAWTESAPGSDVDARVVLEFEHDHYTYTVRRVTTDRKGADGSRTRVRDGEVSLEYVDPTGRHREGRQNPNDAVNRILPADLHRFFFFDGERIERLVKSDSYAEIARAVKDVLGLEIIERAIRHLAQAESRLETELSKVATPEIARITRELGELRNQRDAEAGTLDQARRNLQALQDELDQVTDTLRSLEEARELQARRDQLEGDLEATERVSHAKWTNYGRPSADRDTWRSWAI